LLRANTSTLVLYLHSTLHPLVLKDLNTLTDADGAMPCSDVTPIQSVAKTDCSALCEWTWFPQQWAALPVTR
jgi:hypothetical protein